MKRHWFVATIVVLSLAFLEEAAAATSTLKSSSQVEKVKKVVPQVKPNLAPPPIVTNWSPRERAYPGSRMRISGQDIDIANFVIQLGDGKNAVRLGNLRRYRSYIEATIPQSYTGRRGAPLIVYHRNGQRRVLDPDYQVLNRQAVFAGTSAWHDTENLASSIWTEGQVAIRLDRLEFSSSGSGTYQETTRLLKLTGQTVEPCKEGRTKGSQIVKEFAFQTARSNKSIRWRRLPD